MSNMYSISAALPLLILKWANLPHIPSKLIVYNWLKTIKRHQDFTQINLNLPQNTLLRQSVWVHTTNLRISAHQCSSAWSGSSLQFAIIMALTVPWRRSYKPWTSFLKNLRRRNNFVLTQSLTIMRCDTIVFCKCMVKGVIVLMSPFCIVANTLLASAWLRCPMGSDEYSSPYNCTCLCGCNAAIVHNICNPHSFETCHIIVGVFGQFGWFFIVQNTCKIQDASWMQCTHVYLFLFMVLFNNWW